MHGAFLPDDGLSPSWGRRRNGMLLIFKKTIGRGPGVDSESGRRLNICNVCGLLGTEIKMARVL